MKKIIIGMNMVAMSLMAVDYSQMTMEELAALRGDYRSRRARCIYSR